jgi:hypothetical protein
MISSMMGRGGSLGRSMMVVTLVVLVVAAATTSALDVGLARAYCSEREPLPDRLESIPGWSQTHNIHVHSTYRLNFTAGFPETRFTVAEPSLMRLYIAPDDLIDIDLEITNLNTNITIVRLRRRSPELKRGKGRRQSLEKKKREKICCAFLVFLPSACLSCKYRALLNFVVSNYFFHDFVGKKFRLDVDFFLRRTLESPSTKRRCSV